MTRVQVGDVRMTRVNGSLYIVLEISAGVARLLMTSGPHVGKTPLWPTTACLRDDLVC